MESYYDPKDLAKFPDVGEEAPELARSFSIITEQCLPKESLLNEKRP